MEYTLPKSLEICGADYAIRWDYRAALDICAALSDLELSDTERALAALIILYPDFDSMPEEHYNAALRRCLWYLNGGAEEAQNARRKPVLMNWEQDWPLIVAPVSRIVGYDVRDSERQVHWWTFLSAYMEIGECTFSHVVGIRAKKAKGQKLTKDERIWARENADIVELRRSYTSEEEELLALWGGKAAGEAKDPMTEGM